MTAALVGVSIKAASGLDLPVSDFINGAKSHIGEELANRVLDDGVIERALGGSAVPVEEGEVKTLVGEAYRELKQFMERHEFKDTRRYVHFDKVMQLVDGRDDGKVWVSNENVQRWEEVLAV